MKVMVVGGGGREHAIIKKIKENPRVDEIYALPGNGGIARDAICVPIGPTELDAIVDFAIENAIDYAVIAPDDPLVLGLVDLLSQHYIPCFGPNKAAAIIEGSKAFSKDLMKRYNIPTAEYEIFTDYNKAYSYLEGCKLPVVVKADGLALGKGVLIANTRKEALLAADSMMKDKVFGASGNTIVCEEFLTGPEVSVLAFTDGNTVLPMVSSMDHKRAYDNDLGPNTGGMGTIAPNPYYTEDVAKRCMDEIFLPTIKAMKEEGRTFKGCLYFGLMITADGPKVIEYNCRFGDPEAQVVLPLLKTDLLEIMMAVTEERLSEIDVEFSSDSCCCVIMASQGYPIQYDKGFEIIIPEDIIEDVYIAGAGLKDDKLITSGGRVLGVTAKGETLNEAVRAAYEKVERIYFGNKFYRSDIGKKALDILEEKNGL